MSEILDQRIAEGWRAEPCGEGCSEACWREAPEHHLWFMYYDTKRQDIQHGVAPTGTLTVEVVPRPKPPKPTAKPLFQKEDPPS